MPTWDKSKVVGPRSYRCRALVLEELGLDLGLMECRNLDCLVLGILEMADCGGVSGVSGHATERFDISTEVCPYGAEEPAQLMEEEACSTRLLRHAPKRVRHADDDPLGRTPQQVSTLSFAG